MHFENNIDYFFVDYVLLIKQAVVSRREHDCSSYSNAAGDVKILQNHFPVSLTDIRAIPKGRPHCKTQVTLSEIEENY